MEAIETEIKKGSIVQQQIGTGSYGIVTKVLPNFWKQASAEFKENWIHRFIPSVPLEQLDFECWYEVSMFYDFWGFLGGEFNITTYQSNLAPVRIEQVDGLCRTDAIAGRIIEVVEKPRSLIVYLDPLNEGWECKQPELVINHPTVTPYVGDVVCGTSHYLVIRSDGLNYPYLHQEGVLRQDW